jgi:hypothetical protein
MQPSTRAREWREITGTTRAAIDPRTDGGVPRVAAAPLAAVEPGLDARRTQGGADPRGRLGARGCIAQTDRVVRLGHGG